MKTSLLPTMPLPASPAARWTAQTLRITIRVALPLAVLSVLVICHVAAARELFRSFPYSYSWTELLIDYQGGFAKRGLLGEIAFRLQPYVEPRRVVVDAVAGAYILAVVGEVMVLRLTSHYAGLLFLLSPAGGLFPLLNPEGYGRKDAFVLLALVAGMAIGTRARRRWVALAAPMAIFTAAGLLVEIAWFYYPLVVAATLAVRRGEPARWRFAAAGAAALYTAAAFGLTLAAPPVDTAAIARSWNNIPYYDDTLGALCCLNFRLGDAVGISMATLPNLGGYALGLAVGLLPLALLFARRSPRPVDALTHTVAFVGVVFAMGPVFVAADWGRYIALWLAATFLWAFAAGGAASGDGAGRPAPAFEATHGAAIDAEGLLVRVALLVAYAGTWRLAYYQTPDLTAFLPGAVFQALGFVDPASP